MNKSLCRKIKHEIILKNKSRTDFKEENNYLIGEVERYEEELTKTKKQLGFELKQLENVNDDLMAEIDV